MKKGPDLKLPKLRKPSGSAPGPLADFYYDLRDRRFPVLALVLVAIVATPILLGNKSEPVSVPPAATAALEAAAREPTSKLTVVEATPGLRDYHERLKALALRPLRPAVHRSAGRRRRIRLGLVLGRLRRKRFVLLDVIQRIDQNDVGRSRRRVRQWRFGRRWLGRRQILRRRGAQPAGLERAALRSLGPRCADLARRTDRRRRPQDEQAGGSPPGSRRWSSSPARAAGGRRQRGQPAQRQGLPPRLRRSALAGWRIQLRHPGARRPLRTARTRTGLPAGSHLRRPGNRLPDQGDENRTAWAGRPGDKKGKAGKGSAQGSASEPRSSFGPHRFSK